VLEAAQLHAFAACAKRFGHDLEQLESGAEVVAFPRVPSAQAMRELSPATPEQRRRRAEVFFNPVIAARSRLGQGGHDRFEAVVFAEGTLDPALAAYGAGFFPFPIRTLSVLRKHVRRGECWDLSVRGDRWGLAPIGDICSAVNVGELVIDPGGAVVVQGNLLILVVQRLLCPDVGRPSPYRLGILPTPFSVDSGSGPLNGANGESGADGLDGTDGVRAAARTTIVGPQLLAEPVPNAEHGRDGGDGEPGSRGANGRTGGPTKLADITIGELVGSLTILAAGGCGGDGGDGGRGGNGGRGGDGAAGLRALGGTVGAGRGGRGGRGGDGGDGGRGGHGGICSNVFVSVPAHQARNVHVLAVPAFGGRSGRGGAGGEGGRGATGGEDSRATHQAARRAASGRDGGAGVDGRPGRIGRDRPAPPVFVNEARVPTQAKEEP
jgi:hypothetical protein